MLFVRIIFGIVMFVAVALVVKTFRKHKIPAKPPGPVYPSGPQK